MLENRWGILLIPVALLGLTVFGVHLWTVAAVLVSIVTVARWPVIAADLVPVALTAFAIRGFMIAASWPSLPGLERPAELYGLFVVTTRQTAMLAGAEASAFLVVAAWLVPRTIGAHARTMLVPGRALELEGRVQRLTETRDLAVDAAATELRRIERDLHDGAQARLVALGMNLRAVERMLPGGPEAALALVAEARETSLRALNDLRDLVRGICPPVLADRGLGHAVRALALDTPFPVDLDIDLPGRLTAPVESACYFAVAEALANAVRHSGAQRVHVRMQHTDGLLRVQVADDGAGGVDPARGTGLRGVEQRLAAFDGILAVSSPPGGPTMIAMEVPCALSSPKTCSCSRDGLTRLLTAHGFEIAASVDTAPNLLCALLEQRPDVAIVDVRLPPSFADDGLQAALAARQQVPGLPVLLLSQYVEQLYARELLADQSGAVGYLLKDRVFNDDQFVNAIRTVAAGGTVMDPDVVTKLSAAAPATSRSPGCPRGNARSWR